MATPKRTYNQTELAECFGVTRNTIVAWQAKGLPAASERMDKTKGSEWRFDLAACIKWYAEQKVEEATGSSATKSGTLLAAQIREREAVAELKELEVATKRKELVYIDDVENIVNEVFSVVKSRVRAIPGRLRGKTTEDVVQLVSIETDEILNLVTLDVEALCAQS